MEVQILMVARKNKTAKNNDADKLKTVNLKFDAETKSKLETLAFLNSMKLQTLCEYIIKECLDANANEIAKYEKGRNEFELKK